jgi:anti-sigma B factor antagonist
MPSYLNTDSGNGILHLSFKEGKILDTLLIQEIQEELLPILEKVKERKVVINFGNVTFLSSSALGMLVRAYKRCKQANIQLKLCCIAPDIREVFTITNLDKMLEIYDTARQAEEAFA